MLSGDACWPCKLRHFSLNAPSAGSGRALGRPAMARAAGGRTGRAVVQAPWPLQSPPGLPAPPGLNDVTTMDTGLSNITAKVLDILAQQAQARDQAQDERTQQAQVLKDIVVMVAEADSVAEQPEDCTAKRSRATSIRKGAGRPFFDWSTCIGGSGSGASASASEALPPPQHRRSQHICGPRVWQRLPESAQKLIRSKGRSARQRRRRRNKKAHKEVLCTGEAASAPPPARWRWEEVYPRLSLACPVQVGRPPMDPSPAEPPPKVGHKRRREHASDKGPSRLNRLHAQCRWGARQWTHPRRSRRRRWGTSAGGRRSKPGQRARAPRVLPVTARRRPTMTARPGAPRLACPPTAAPRPRRTARPPFSDSKASSSEAPSAAPPN